MSRFSDAVVAAFDDGTGLGEVALESGERLPFHCTAIADGTRSIEVGARVLVGRRLGVLGRVEADPVVRLA